MADGIIDPSKPVEQAQTVTIAVIGPDRRCSFNVPPERALEILGAAADDIRYEIFKQRLMREQSEAMRNAQVLARMRGGGHG